MCSELKLVSKSPISETVSTSHRPLSPGKLIIPAGRIPTHLSTDELPVRAGPHKTPVTGDVLHNGVLKANCEGHCHCQDRIHVAFVCKAQLETPNKKSFSSVTKKQQFKQCLSRTIHSLEPALCSERQPACSCPPGAYRSSWRDK